MGCFMAAALYAGEPSNYITTDQSKGRSKVGCSAFETGCNKRRRGCQCMLVDLSFAFTLPPIPRDDLCCGMRGSDRCNGVMSACTFLIFLDLSWSFLTLVESMMWLRLSRAFLLSRRAIDVPGIPTSFCCHEFQADCNSLMQSWSVMHSYRHLQSHLLFAYCVPTCSTCGLKFVQDFPSVGSDNKNPCNPQENAIKSWE